MIDQAPTRPDRPARSNRPFWIAIGVLALLLIATYLWMGVRVNRAENRLADSVRQAVEENTRAMLGLAALPLGLSVREDAMSRNFGQMEARFERLVQEPGVERVLFAAANDSIVVSTDRSLIGRPLSSAIPIEHARPVGTSVVLADSLYLAIVPITGLNERLGVLALTYRGPRSPEEPSPADSAAEGE